MLIILLYMILFIILCIKLSTDKQYFLAYYILFILTEEDKNLVDIFLQQETKRGKIITILSNKL